jgi:nicotinamidase/pyrazinamidase
MNFYEILTSIFYRTALIVVDVQNGFCSGGSLPVPNGDTVVPVINQLRSFLSVHFKAITVLTKDWHPADHCSFMINNPGSTLFQPWKLANGVMQMMWPVHCVQNTKDAEFHPALYVKTTDPKFKKGKFGTDSYSGFGDATMKLEDTGLLTYLLSKWVYRVVVVGLATDYCVKATIMHAQEFGFQSYLVLSCCRGVDLKSTTAAIEEMRTSHLDADGKPKISMRTGRSMYPIIIVADQGELMNTF